MALLAELTHRCPLACPYCSNPLELTRIDEELSTAEWIETFRQASALGILHLHLSGGEPASRRDLVELTRAAASFGLYTNLITSGIGLTQARVADLADAGLDHVQLSIQGVTPEKADVVSGYKGGFARKMAVAGWVHEAGIPLTVNAVCHKQNMEEIGGMLELAIALGARRIEIATVQFHGWAERNRQALMPTRYPKACMGGWARIGLNITPSGKVLPCHAAETIAHLAFDNVRARPLEDIWYEGAAFNAYRGDDWTQEPCRSCDRKHIDFGGCRCQAMAMAGDAAATDPVCVFSPLRADLAHNAMLDAEAAIPSFVYRGR
jgi:pyrroloquinoline quinone biosynthesis protein E